MDYKKEAIKVMNENNWKSEYIDEDGIWLGTDKIDVNIFLTDKDNYKYGIDVYDCKLNNNGYIETKNHLLTFYK
tara:strand:+ start:238 stop:459 length:222 start_codon:yes stop_codon:yes gene_type:complete